MIETLIRIVLFVLIAGYAIVLFVQAVQRRYRYVKLGQSVWGGGAGETKEGARSAGFAAQTFGQTKLLKDPKSGAMHAIIFYGFIIVQFGALDLIVKGLAGRGIPWFDAAWFSLSQEVTAALVVLAIGYAAFRRYGENLKRLKKGWKPGIVVFFIVFLMLSVLFALAFERAREGMEFSPFAPLSSLIAAMFGGLSYSAASVLFEIAWWIHLLLLLAFLVYVPQSKHFHIIVAPINIWLRRTDSPGRLSKLDLEDENAESFGVHKIEDFTQKQMIDFYACVECGRCTNVCPASNTGKLLSPMHLITKLRDHLTEKGAALTSKSPWVPEFAFADGGVHRMGDPKEAFGAWDGGAVTDIGPTMQAQTMLWSAAAAGKSAEQIELIGDVITEEEIWACTTCRNCEDQCPVDNEHVDKIVDLRRHLVLMQGSLPHDGQRALQNIERQGNPWGISRADRAKWIGELAAYGDVEAGGDQADRTKRVPTVKENPDFEFLYFVGSMGAYDNRSKKITHSFVRLLQEAGVNFAVLGNEEKNSGDTPRRMGNEFLFQQLCAENIAMFEKYGVTKIVTACPHTYNTLKNEYPDFGLQAEVLHHTELLDRLVREGRLVPKYEVKERITYHDSCYLGRYNGVYDPPRRILQAIPGVELAEMERARENGMCCGAGGGRMWMEETAGKRVNLARTEQALAVRPTMIGSACPYCLTMLEDGTKMKEVENEVKARDVAEILALSVFGGDVAARETKGEASVQ
ncbi:putative iron-sulfur-binding oxidoreductase FadF [Paenibacillus sp. CECT 9249]|uniref:heterodisulfide reductase-related iron-sulfur binding cluster n=1 Tax=Paenibacillus sp. CECT 9249 TaxID=2845385 RepID=UPI001E5BC473|nr:(Fe-S)-binding protein [Paenibacillus sp. CECT 9249]CAH0120440.1 putative iron-sulfur-binding oxidoreductase FadF [Paenibacillus sp. CECT 9249]